MKMTKFKKYALITAGVLSIATAYRVYKSRNKTVTVTVSEEVNV